MNPLTGLKEEWLQNSQFITMEALRMWEKNKTRLIFHHPPSLNYGVASRDHRDHEAVFGIRFESLAVASHPLQPISEFYFGSPCPSWSLWLNSRINDRAPKGRNEVGV